MEKQLGERIFKRISELQGQLREVQEEKVRHVKKILEVESKLVNKSELRDVHKKVICRLQEEREEHLHKISELECKLVDECGLGDVYKKVIRNLQEEKVKHLNRISELEANLVNECGLGGVHNTMISNLQDQLIEGHEGKAEYLQKTSKLDAKFLIEAEEKVEHVLKRISELQAQVHAKLKECEKRTVVKKLKDVTEVRYIKCECTPMKDMYKYDENLHSCRKENSSSNASQRSSAPTSKSIARRPRKRQRPDSSSRKDNDDSSRSPSLTSSNEQLRIPAAMPVAESSRTPSLTSSDEQLFIPVAPQA